MRGQFWCKFRFGAAKTYGLWGVYGILEVWVKRGSTVVLGTHNPQALAEEKMMNARLTLWAMLCSWKRTVKRDRVDYVLEPAVCMALFLTTTRHALKVSGKCRF